MRNKSTQTREKVPRMGIKTHVPTIASIFFVNKAKTIPIAQISIGRQVSDDGKCPSLLVGRTFKSTLFLRIIHCGIKAEIRIRPARI